MTSILQFTFVFFVPIIFYGNDDIDRYGRRQGNQERRQPAFDPDDPLAYQPDHQICDSRQYFLHHEHLSVESLSWLSSHDHYDHEYLMTLAIPLEYFNINMPSNVSLRITVLLFVKFIRAVE